MSMLILLLIVVGCAVLILFWLWLAIDDIKDMISDPSWWTLLYILIDVAATCAWASVGYAYLQDLFF